MRGAIHDGLTADDLRPWFTAVASDHLLSYGHGAIYCQKAFELLDMIGWDRADTVLPYLVPTIVYGTREDVLPYTRPFMRTLADVDLAALADLEVDDAWRDDGTLLATLLGDDRRAIVPSVVGAMHAGAGVAGVLDVVVETVGERMMRYDPNGERDLLTTSAGSTSPMASRTPTPPAGTTNSRRGPTPSVWRCTPRSSPSGPAATNGTPESANATTAEPSTAPSPTPAMRSSARRCSTTPRRSSSTPTASRRAAQPPEKRPAAGRCCPCRQSPG